VWIEELQFGDEVLTDPPGVIVAALSWRDPTFS
jgi:hypothetical protein